MRTIEIGSKVRARDPVPCGSNAPTLVIASIGTSGEADDVADEISKARVAQQVGAGAVTDHSFYGEIPAYHTALIEALDILVSTVGCYEFAAAYQGRRWANVAASGPLEFLEAQMRRGVDMITVHASLRQEDLIPLANSTRLIPSTSKGGGIVASYMRHTKRENPYYEHFDEVLDLATEFGTTISLGTTFRPATVCDGWDHHLASETEVMGELVHQATSAGVNIMIEGLGHATIEAMPTLIRLAKLHTNGVPYRILPMATDAALGFDHISGAIGTATAVAGGADAVTCMSRAEHIGLPSLEDMREAIIATRIGAHCGALARTRDLTSDSQISRTRWAQGCKGDWEAAVYPAGAREALAERNRLNDQLIQCGMCGDFCGIAAGIAAVKASNRSRSRAPLDP